MRSLVVAAGTLLLASCGAGEGPDWLLAEARAPGRPEVARLWCENFCDTPDSATLTISPNSRLVQLDRQRGPWDPYAKGQLPEDDRVQRVWTHPADGVRAKLYWRDPLTLIVEGPCLNDGNGRPLQPSRSGEITIVPVRGPSNTPCPGPA